MALPPEQAERQQYLIAYIQQKAGRRELSGSEADALISQVKELKTKATEDRIIRELGGDLSSFLQVRGISAPTAPPSRIGTTYNPAPLSTPIPVGQEFTPVRPMEQIPVAEGTKIVTVVPETPTNPPILKVVPDEETIPTTKTAFMKDYTSQIMQDKAKAQSQIDTTYNQLFGNITQTKQESLNQISTKYGEYHSEYNVSLGNFQTTANKIQNLSQEWYASGRIGEPIFMRGTGQISLSQLNAELDKQAQEINTFLSNISLWKSGEEQKVSDWEIAQLADLSLWKSGEEQKVSDWEIAQKNIVNASWKEWSAIPEGTSIIGTTHNPPGLAGSYKKWSEGRISNIDFLNAAMRQNLPESLKIDVGYVLTKPADVQSNYIKEWMGGYAQNKVRELPTITQPNITAPTQSKYAAEWAEDWKQGKISDIDLLKIFDIDAANKARGNTTAILGGFVPAKGTATEDKSVIDIITEKKPNIESYEFGKRSRENDLTVATRWLNEGKISQKEYDKISSDVERYWNQKPIWEDPFQINELNKGKISDFDLPGEITIIPKSWGETYTTITPTTSKTPWDLDPFSGKNVYLENIAYTDIALQKANLLSAYDAAKRNLEQRGQDWYDWKKQAKARGDIVPTDEPVFMHEVPISTLPEDLQKSLGFGEGSRSTYIQYIPLSQAEKELEDYRAGIDVWEAEAKEKAKQSFEGEYSVEKYAEAGAWSAGFSLAILTGITLFSGGTLTIPTVLAAGSLGFGAGVVGKGAEKETIEATGEPWLGYGANLATGTVFGFGGARLLTKLTPTSTKIGIFSKSWAWTDPFDDMGKTVGITDVTGTLKSQSIFGATKVKPIRGTIFFENEPYLYAEKVGGDFEVKYIGVKAAPKTSADIVKLHLQKAIAEGTYLPSESGKKIITIIDDQQLPISGDREIFKTKAYGFFGPEREQSILYFGGEEEVIKQLENLPPGAIRNTYVFKGQLKTLEGLQGPMDVLKGKGEFVPREGTTRILDAEFLAEFPEQNLQVWKGTSETKMWANTKNAISVINEFETGITTKTGTGISSGTGFGSGQTKYPLLDFTRQQADISQAVSAMLKSAAEKSGTELSKQTANLIGWSAGFGAGLGKLVGIEFKPSQQKETPKGSGAGGGGVGFGAGQTKEGIDVMVTSPFVEDVVPDAEYANLKPFTISAPEGEFTLFRKDPFRSKETIQKSAEEKISEVFYPWSYSEKGISKPSSMQSDSPTSGTKTLTYEQYQRKQQAATAKDQAEMEKHILEDIDRFSAKGMFLRPSSELSNFYKDIITPTLSSKHQIGTMTIPELQSSLSRIETEGGKFFSSGFQWRLQQRYESELEERQRTTPVLPKKIEFTPTQQPQNKPIEFTPTKEKQIQIPKGVSIDITKPKIESTISSFTKPEIRDIGSFPISQIGEITIPKIIPIDITKPIVDVITGPVTKQGQGIGQIERTTPIQIEKTIPKTTQKEITELITIQKQPEFPRVTDKVIPIQKEIPTQAIIPFTTTFTPPKTPNLPLPKIPDPYYPFIPTGAWPGVPNLPGPFKERRARGGQRSFYWERINPIASPQQMIDRMFGGGKSRRFPSITKILGGKG